jgi:hypothetical protein
MPRRSREPWIQRRLVATVQALASARLTVRATLLQQRLAEPEAMRS